MSTLVIYRTLPVGCDVLLLAPFGLTELVVGDVFGVNALKATRERAFESAGLSSKSKSKLMVVLMHLATFGFQK